MTRTSAILLLTALTLWQSEVQAQFGASMSGVPGQWYAPGMGNYGNQYGGIGGYGNGRNGYGGYGYGRYGGTASQGYMQGMSAVIRAEGQYAVMQSQAATNYERARGAYIDNQNKWFENFQERKRFAQERREEAAAHEREVVQRYLKNHHSGLPPRLTPSQFDPVTGYLVWPNALQAPIFADERKKIEELVLQRVFTSGTTTTAAQLHTAAREMQSHLKTIIRSTVADEYIEARKFLESLAFEGRFHPEPVVQSAKHDDVPPTQ